MQPREATFPQQNAILSPAIRSERDRLQCHCLVADFLAAAIADGDHIHRRNLVTDAKLHEAEAVWKNERVRNSARPVPNIFQIQTSFFVANEPLHNGDRLQLTRQRNDCVVQNCNSAHANLKSIADAIRENSVVIPATKRNCHIFGKNVRAVAQVAWLNSDNVQFFN